LEFFQDLFFNYHFTNEVTKAHRGEITKNQTAKKPVNSKPVLKPKSKPTVIPGRHLREP
jgi:hypothetical protein